MAPTADTALLSLVPLGTLLASLAGSLHCVGMCGGLVTAFAPAPGAMVRYHLGRGLTYAALGALAGGIGQSVFSPAVTAGLGVFATASMALLLVAMGIQLWRGQGVHLFALPKPVLQFIYRGANRGAFLAGVLTGVLPCGWLHGFVISALALQSSWKGAAFLTAFWVGTLPALSFGPAIARNLLGRFSRYSPKLAGGLMIAMAALAVGVRWNHAHHPHAPSHADPAAADAHGSAHEAHPSH